MNSSLELRFLSVIMSLMCATNADDVTKRKLKILIDSPAFGFSHMQFQGRLADVLVEAGHEVHILVVDIVPNLKTYNGSVKAHKIIRVPRPEKKSDQMSTMQGLQNPLLGMLPKFVGLFMDFANLFKGVCEELTHNVELIDQLTAERYDVGIAEFYQFCSLAIFHRIGIKTKLGSYNTPLTPMSASNFGIPSISSYSQNPLFSFIEGMNANFFQRTIKFYYGFFEANYMSPTAVHMYETVVQSAFGNDFPTLKQLARNTSLIFVNTNEMFEFPKPISNKVVYIGGIVRSEVKPLDENVKSILEGSKKGAILLSFGTMWDSTKLSEQLKLSFLKVFSKFPDYDFIWKIKANERDIELLRSSTNLHVFEWVDQRSIIAHPKLAAFITHCGQNSVVEAVHSGVPLVGIPLFGDQIFNAALMLHKEIGEYVDIKAVDDPDVIAQALEKVLNDPKYRQNAELIKKKMQLAPFTPEEKLVKWVEFAAEFPELNELNLPTVQEMGFMAYYSLDCFLLDTCIVAAHFGDTFFKILVVLSFFGEIWEIHQKVCSQKHISTVSLKTDSRCDISRILAID
ncbi:UDP-glucoronosyl and UDP-glucosyl transferase domain-containing protein [Ditylenchus destructor]|nr:UDP-glucoronosyl and UDP-glucosyl transferase domain-containing protein [Ditylenchus destructor]